MYIVFFIITKGMTEMICKIFLCKTMASISKTKVLFFFFYQICPNRNAIVFKWTPKERDAP